MRTTGPSRSELFPDPPPLILAELVECRGRAGAQMFIGHVDGLRIMRVRHGERRRAAGECDWDGGSWRRKPKVC
jgi:hypothetical protein